MNSLRSLCQQIVPLRNSTKSLFAACTIPSRSHYNDSFLSGSNSAYIEDMYNAWLKNPASVHASWDSYFKNSQNSDSAYVRPPLLGHLGRNEMFLSQVKTAAGGGGERAASSGPGGDLKSISDHMKVQGVIRSYQSRGHLTAKLDPLELTLPSKERIGLTPREITEKYALSKDLMDKEFLLPPTTFIGGDKKSLPLIEIVRRLEEIYCSHIGVEYVKIDNHKQRQWIREKLETPGVRKITADEKRLLLARLTRSHGFEQFLAKKWPSEKRFGLEGCEVLIPAMKQIIDRSTLVGVESFIIGIPHRGRLNVLANVCRKPLYQILIQFAALESHEEGSGDVKYHLGTYIERLNRVTNKKVKIALMANPSHLETIDPVVQGRTKAEQFYNGDHDGTRTLSVLLHGDASFCGQGVVYETMHLSDLPAYTTHGTIHIVINNQVGFTTDPRNSRSSPFCTDVGHVVTCPIFHVNSDDPEAVMHVCNLAAEWRATFKKDVVIDLVCYRRNGHNEADEPMFTQPIMYTKIRKLKPILHKYSEKLIKEGVVKKEEVDDISKKYSEICNEGFAVAQKQTQLKFSEWIDSPWHGFFKGKDPLKCKPTGIKDDVIQQIAKVFASPPPSDFEIHRGIDRILKARMKLVEAKQMDWALGEAFAWGSLLKEGIHVRLSGEDVERGTFSHRHHVLHHQTKDKVVYRPLDKVFPNQAPYTVCNSSLSEYGVLGFEVGFSLMNPNSLVMWEAQFGDFHNTGQCIIDTVITSGQSKWIRQSGLVLLLPHGMEGMGPEHSSARPERWLQMSTDDPDTKPPYGPEFAMRQLYDTNMIVANCSGPGNYFHLMRRQIALPFRKPLVVFTPKSLLKLPDARSPFDEIKEGTEFRRLIPEDGPASKKPEGVKKLIFCTGKVYYELSKVMKERKLEEQIAISRIEQLVPFPYDLVKVETEKYKNAKIVWAQEEHKNHGYWSYVFHRIQDIVGKNRDVHYVGRATAAAPACGYKFQHYKESKQLIADATAL